MSDEDDDSDDNADDQVQDDTARVPPGQGGAQRRAGRGPGEGESRERRERRQPEPRSHQRLIGTDTGGNWRE